MPHKEENHNFFSSLKFNMFMNDQLKSKVDFTKAGDPCLVNDQLYPYLLRVCGLDSHEASETEVSKNRIMRTFSY